MTNKKVSKINGKDFSSISELIEGKKIINFSNIVLLELSTNKNKAGKIAPILNSSIIAPIKIRKKSFKILNLLPTSLEIFINIFKF